MTRAVVKQAGAGRTVAVAGDVYRFLATGFEETWEFQRTASGTHVTRSFRLHARSALARLPLRGIAFLLKRAVARHLREMRAGGEVGRPAVTK